MREDQDSVGVSASVDQKIGGRPLILPNFSVNSVDFLDTARDVVR